MSDFKLPFGAEFSPDKIEIDKVLKMVLDLEGEPTGKLIQKLSDTYFHNTSMAGNCKNSMVSYEILQSGGGINLSDFGKELVSYVSVEDVYFAMGKRILTYLNGLTFIEAIRNLQLGGERPTLEKLTETLNLMGCEPLAKTNKSVATMKKWLEKAGILNGWTVKNKELEKLIGVGQEEIEILKGLSEPQMYFIRALCNTGSDDYQSSAQIRDLANVSFHVSFPGKNFSTQIIKPLEEKGLIERLPEASPHGGNAPKVKMVDSVKAMVLSPVLEQIKIITGKEVVKYCQKSLTELRKEIDSRNKHVKGLALEAFAIRIMRIIDLNFVGTRVKGNRTGGAEIDAIFDTTRMSYSRWQVQCKNTATVELDQVAKEVGLSHVLKSNVIVILTTGRVSGSAKEYANRIMREMNLCIIFIEGEDVDEILTAPSSIVGILNRESMEAKRIKILDIHKDMS